MVASEKCNSLRVSQFQQHQVCNCLYAKIASINVISKEQIVCVRDFPTNSKKLDQVVKLPVDIPDYSDWCPHLLHIFLES
jgi:hypothetical protein